MPEDAVPQEPLPAAPPAPASLRVEGSAGVVPRVRAVGRLVGDAALAPVYRAYAARLRAEVLARPVPNHVALIMDGNRRWAREVGLRGITSGHQHGADKAIELLDWCSAVGIGEVTLWALSLENLDRSRRGGRGDHGDRPGRRSMRWPRATASGAWR